MTPLRHIATLACLGVIAAACGTDTTATPSKIGPKIELAAETASFDLAAGSPGRYLLGVFDTDGANIVDGTVNLTFRSLDDDTRSEAPVVATFVAVAGHENRTPASSPHRAGVDDGAGVYQVDDVTFPAAGNWETTATFTLDGKRTSVTDAFEVQTAHIVPTVGQAAKPSVNTLAGDPSAPPTAIDSRATGDTPIPDPALHATTVAAAITSGKPTLIVVSTPTYCLSRFCGPITETVQALQTSYAGRANFIHLEVWHDFESKEVNKSAADWILGPDNSGGNEPWVFLVDAAGTITERWDNVTNATLLTDAIDQQLN